VHLVDLDAAFSGEMRALDTLRAVASIDRRVEVQFGGGIRSAGAIERALAHGASWVIVGSAAAQPGFLETALRASGGRTLLGLDVRGQDALVAGWTEQAGRFDKVAQEAINAGVKTAVITSTTRDGTLDGPDLTAALQVARMGLGVIVSGGIGTLGDIARVCRESGQNSHPASIEGIIIGKALYEGRFELAAAARLVGDAAGEVEGRPCRPLV
jgi:phosphoribosylformimino-5-aminoimidazole carboxamide ribonucleotide (ProFAR) isomerase